MDPYQYITIASTCMGIYKTLFLHEDYIVKLDKPSGQTTKLLQATLKCSKWNVLLDGDCTVLDTLDGYKMVAKKFLNSPIAQVSSSGYSPRDNFSKVSIQWLNYLMHESEEAGNPIHIQHALNGGEYRIPGSKYRVDGFCAITYTVYEFHGCVWHGCLKCYPNDRLKTRTPRTNQSMNELYALTMEKKSIIKQMGYSYVCIWEHEFSKRVENDEHIKDFIKGLDVQTRLDPRDGFYGGRTNCTKLYYEAKDDETIKYVDCCSLYPYVNAYSAYPVGHPDIIT